MPPAKPDGCRYDDSEFRKRVEDDLWFSKESLLVRVDRLEKRVDNQRFWTPILFGAAATGIFALMQIAADAWLK